MKKILPLLLIFLLFVSCKNESIPYENVDTIALSTSQSTQSQTASMETDSVSTMVTSISPPAVTTSVAVSDEETLKKKIAGLFFVKPETLANSYTNFTEKAKENLEKYPVCGIIFFRDNIIDIQQTNDFISAFENANISGNKLWFGVDMEGGNVNRFPKDYFTYMQISAFKMAEENTPEEVGEIYYNLGNDLKEWGFNVDFAPDADIFSNPANGVIGHRAFGSDPETVSKYSSAAAFGLQKSGVMPVIKHFPGHGDVAGDTHKSFVVEDKTLEELRDFEMVPFNYIIGNKSYNGGVMVAHIECPNITGNDLPASLSPVIITDILRGETDFDGVVFTDSLEMGAIENEYGAGDAAVLAVLAGADVLLMPPNLKEAVNAVYDAVKSGKITETRIDESLARIAKVKTLYS